MNNDDALLLEIHAAVVGLAYLADYGSVEDYMGCLCEDAQWIVSRPGNGHATQDRAQVEAGVRQRRAKGAQGPGSAVRHVVNSVAAQRNADGTASTVSYYSLFRRTDTEPQLSSMGRYFDTWRREEGRWRIARRTVVAG